MLLDGFIEFFHQSPYFFLPAAATDMEKGLIGLTDFICPIAPAPYN